MTKGSTTGMLGVLKALKSTKSTNCMNVQKKIDVYAATAKEKEKDKKKKHFPAKNDSGNTNSAPVRKAMPILNPLEQANELNMGNELTAILTLKKRGPALTPKR